MLRQLASRETMYLLESFTVGAFQCNCVILADEHSREAIVIDPGDEPHRVLERVRQYGLRVKALIHTHAHLDHIMGTRDVQHETGAEVLLHPEDRWLYQNLAMQCGMFGWNADEPPPIDGDLGDGDAISFGEHELRVLHTPGHTPGSVCFELAGERPLLFSGDTLFQRGVGRTDLWGGSHAQLIHSIRSRLLVLPDPTQVVPGHGPQTTIFDERRKNPFLT